MQAKPIQITYTKVGQRAGGAKRLWLEGLRLRAARFEPGARYKVIFDLTSHTVVLELDEAGDRVVAGRRPAGKEEATPILDLASAAITDFVGVAGRVRAEISVGRIVFSLHPADVAIGEREERTRANIAAGTLTEGTLCAGGGIATFGLEIGLGLEGLDTRVEWVIDRERKYLEVGDANNPSLRHATTLVEASLEDVEPHLLPKVDALSISLPCTLHSKAGKAKRHLKNAEEHPTDALALVGAWRIIEAVNPTIIVSENVTEAENSASYIMLTAYLEDRGYRVFRRVMNEKDAGTLERRSRYWFVAISTGLADGFSIDDLKPFARMHATLGEVLDVTPEAEWRKHEYLDAKELRDRAAGKGFTRQLVTAASEYVGCVGRAYGKRRSTEPFLTRADGLERLLTPSEHARVKGIPEFLVAGASSTVAHEILGQSILMPHAIALGSAIAKHLLGVHRSVSAVLSGAAATYREPLVVVPLTQPIQASLGF